MASLRISDGRQNALRAAMKFINELGNTITIDVTGDGIYCIVSIIGPTSETENIITQLEAKMLYRMLGAFLGKDACICKGSSSLVPLSS